MRVYPDDPEYRRYKAAKTRAWYEENRERALAGKKAYNARPEIKYRRLNAALVRNYGITLEQKDAIFAAQGRRCAICRTETSRKWEVDHCHSSGAVRGVLCSSSNLMIGHGRDSADVLASAMEYLVSGADTVARIIKK